MQNRYRFEANQYDAVWGKIDGNTAYIIRREFDRMCSDEGFNSRALLSWLIRNKKAVKSADGKNTVTTRINGRVTRVIALILPGDEEFEMEGAQEIEMDPQQVFNL